MRVPRAVALIAALLVAYWAMWNYFERNAKPTPLQIEEDPTFGGALNRLHPTGMGEAPDVSIRYKGKPVKLSDYKGKVVLLDFWATWCGPCRESIPGVVELYDKYKGKGFQVMGPAMEKDNGSLVPRAAEMFKMDYPVGVPLERDPVEALNTRSLPTMVLVDKKGIVRWHQNGYLPGMEKTVEGYVQKLLAE